MQLAYFVADDRFDGHRKKRTTKVVIKAASGRRRTPPHKKNGGVRHAGSQRHPGEITEPPSGF